MVSWKPYIAPLSLPLYIARQEVSESRKYRFECSGELTLQEKTFRDLFVLLVSFF